MSECRPGVLSGPRKRSLSPSLPLRMRHRRAWGLGRDVPPEPPLASLPKPGGFGWNWNSPLRRNKALPSMIPHRSTKLGTLAQRRGIEGGMVEQTRTHARTAPAARLRAKAHSADALAAVNTRTVSPWRVERCLMLKASPFDQEGTYTYF